MTLHARQLSSSWLRSWMSVARTSGVALAFGVPCGSVLLALYFVDSAGFTLALLLGAIFIFWCGVASLPLTLIWRQNSTMGSLAWSSIGMTAVLCACGIILMLLWLSMSSMGNPGPFRWDYMVGHLLMLTSFSVSALTFLVLVKMWQLRRVSKQANESQAHPPR